MHLILSLLLALPPDADHAMVMLGSPRCAQRILATRWLEAACDRDHSVTYHVVAGLDSPDVEVRSRCNTILQHVARCHTCGGSGLIRNEVGIGQWRRVDEYKCVICVGTGIDHGKIPQGW